MSYAIGSKHDEKFAEWAKLIGQCMQSGKPIAHWCKENGVSNERYRYWLKRLHCTIESLKNVSIVIEESGILPIGDNAVAVSAATDSMPEIVQVDLRKPSAMLVGDATEGIRMVAESTPTMSIHIGEARCDIYHGADSDTIERALLTLAKIC